MSSKFTRLLAASGALVVSLPLAFQAVATPAINQEVDADGYGPQLMGTTSFEDGEGEWWVSEDLADSLTTETGALCVAPAGGTPSAWSSIVGIDNIPLVKGESYEFSFTIKGTSEHRIRALVQMNEPPWTDTFEANPETTADFTTHTFNFTSALDWEPGQIVFQIGGNSESWGFCLQDASFRVAPPPDPYVPDTGPAVRVNQFGYLADGPRFASVVNESTTPLDWELVDEAGAVVGQGKTELTEPDKGVNATVHTVDLSAVTATGSGFVLRVAGEESYPFAIGQPGYGKLFRDALTYFYLARSGTPIDGNIVGDERYTRDAGHVDVAPNQGDGAVGCHAPFEWHEGWTCDYTLDVRGGWYDAGDHGKYVVNGGISVWQLLDTWERAALLYGTAGAENSFLGDSTAQLPERGNGVPDILDEARWELEWMRKMIVPAGQQYEGMVHHKVQDDAWTGLPLLPALDDKPRQLHRPSTAATLNFAAAAAKGARLWEPYDADFAAALLADGAAAWQAALANPEVYANVLDGDTGGGPYDDDNVTDEFYWAAAELFLSTGEQQYADYLEASDWHGADLRSEGGFTWQDTAMLGAISLATVPSDLASRQQVVDTVLHAADYYLSVADRSVFGMAYSPTSSTFGWGSNSSVVNNTIVLAVAYDITGDDKYRAAALESMDYLLGRNVLNISYVTGYGTVYAQNQHHRWMAPSMSNDLPPVYPGTLAGGPNSGIEDPVAKATWPAGCRAQWCYLDDIQSWSTNEMTINWNAALTWYAAWVTDQETPTTAAEESKGFAPFFWVGLGLAALLAAGALLVQRTKREDDAPAGLAAEAAEEPAAE